LALARQRPGQITCGSVGNGSSAHLSLALLQHMTGLQFVHVPYRGSSPAVIALAHMPTEKTVHIGQQNRRWTRRGAKVSPSRPADAERGLPRPFRLLTAPVW
jgi:hypothetical protein